MEETLLVGLAAIVVLGIGAQWLAWRVNLPSILLLLIVGFIAGPGLHLIDPDVDVGKELLFPLVSLAVAIILFEGGLSLQLRELKSVGSIALRLVSVGVLVTWVLATLFAWLLTDLGRDLSILLGALLTVTGPTVVGPLLRHVRPRGRIGPAAKWEGIVADPVGAILAVLVLHAILLGEPLDSSTGSVLAGLSSTFLVGGLIGALGALFLYIFLRNHWIPDFLQSPFSLAVVLGVFTVSQAASHESGLVAVTLMGFLLANQKRTPVKHIVEFKENLRVLLISSLFIILAARLSFDDLLGAPLASYAFVVALIVVVRPVAVWVATLGSGLDWREKLFLAWLAPRGIVAAAISALFALQLTDAGIDGGETLAPLTFLVIIGTVTVYGLTAAPLARRLGLADPDPQGVAIAGVTKFACEVARALQEAGLSVVMMDTNRRRVGEARLAGLNAQVGSILSEDAEHELDLCGIGRLLALTPNDEVNALAALHFAETFGRARVYQLVPTVEGGRESAPGELRGRELFDEKATYADLEARVQSGASIKLTPLTGEFDFDSFRELYGERALPLFRLSESGKLWVFTVDDPPAPPAGQTLLSLVDPSPDAAPEDA